jgi:hypothetical protein
MIGYNEYGYSEREYTDTSYSASWTNTYTFTYVAGTTVVILPALTGTIPVGTTVKIYAGETILTLVEIPDAVETGIVYMSTVSGATNLYVRLVFNTSSRAINPIISSLGLTVKQSTSLYTLATQILADGLEPANADWEIDTELQKYLIPYSWLSQQSHRSAIGLVAEAAGGVAYQNRYGVVRVEAGNYLSRKTAEASLFTIGKNRIYDLSSPVSTVKNRIQIKTFPYVADASQTIWALSSSEDINNAQVLEFDITWHDFEAAIDCSAAITSVPAGATITEETYYSGGAHIEITGSVNGQKITVLTITGKPLIVVGSEIITETDGDSIRRNGDKALSIMENNLIQSNTLAEEVAEDILETTAEEFRDVKIDWRGDPTLELGDKGIADGIPGVIVTQEFNHDGILRAKAQIRKV